MSPNTTCNSTATRGRLLSYALADDHDTVFELSADLSICNCARLARDGECAHQKGLKAPLEQLCPRPGGTGTSGNLRASWRPACAGRGREEDSLSTTVRAADALTRAPAPFPRGYEIEEEIGRGGMGVVYRARQSALKMLLYSGHEGADALTRFRTEAEALARLKHPGIVAIHEVGELSGLPFFAMEWGEGGSLDRKLAGRPLPAKEAAALVRSLSQAMQSAHEAQVIHRDLKPANVLLSADGTPR